MILSSMIAANPSLGVVVEETVGLCDDCICIDYKFPTEHFLSYLEHIDYCRSTSAKPAVRRPLSKGHPRSIEQELET